MEKTHTEQVEKIASLVKDTNIAMLTSITSEGHFHSRPMATMDIEFDGDIWFFTQKSSPKVSEIETNPQVNVSYSNPEKQNYVSLAGEASLVIDHELNKKYWNPIFKAWFPEGLNDPELALIKVEVASAEYWDSPSSVVAHVAGFIKSKLGGEDTDIGEHGTINL
jgi:general stress protein 26